MMTITMMDKAIGVVMVVMHGRDPWGCMSVSHLITTIILPGPNIYQAYIIVAEL